MREDITNFSFKMFKIMRSLRSSKCLKTTVELTFTTQKANACSPWTACSVFNWKYLFWVNLVQKLKIISLSWNFAPRLIQICRNLWWCPLFLFSTENTFLDKFGPKNQMSHFKTKFGAYSWVPNRRPPFPSLPPLIIFSTFFHPEHFFPTAY